MTRCCTDFVLGSDCIEFYNCCMKPLPAPEVPGKTEFERFDNAVRQVLTVSKKEILRREAEEKQRKESDKLDRK